MRLTDFLCEFGEAYEDIKRENMRKEKAAKAMKRKGGRR